jgi:hypothetical protein
MLPVITKEQVANEGIKIEVTQGDVIDMLVNEQVNAILAQKEALNQRTEELYLKLKQEDEKFKKLLKLPKGTIFTDWNVKNQYSDDCKLVVINKIIEDNNNKSNTSFYVSKAYSLLYGNLDLTVYIKLVHEGLDFKSNISLKTKCSFSKSILEEISQHNIEIVEFVQKFPKLNETAVAKKIKSQFTKQIVKGTSKEFRQALEKSFGVSI